MTELPPYGVIILVIWGTITALDLVSVPQAMLSRPLVAGTVAGWLAGDIEAGLRVGVLFECFALDVLPIGAVRYPDYGPATVVAAALAAGAPWEFGLGIGAALGVVLAILGGWSLQFVRRWNARAIQHRTAALAAGESSAIRLLQYGSLMRDGLRGASLTALGLAVAALIAVKVPLDRRTAVGLSLVAIGGALAAAINGAHPERRPGRSPPVADRWCGCRDPVGGAYVNGGWRAQLRLLAVQGTWNYERMLGVGMGYAAEPLLEDLKTVDPVRHSEAVVRSTEFFNCHPYLAGLALGATARAEYEAVPGRRSPGFGLRSAVRSERSAMSCSGPAWCRRSLAWRCPPWCWGPDGGPSVASWCCTTCSDWGPASGLCVRDTVQE